MIANLSKLISKTKEQGLQLEITLKETTQAYEKKRVDMKDELEKMTLENDALKAELVEVKKRTNNSGGQGLPTYQECEADFITQKMDLKNMERRNYELNKYLKSTLKAYQQRREDLIQWKVGGVKV